MSTNALKTTVKYTKKDKVIMSMLVTGIILLTTLILFASFGAKADTSYKPNSDIHASVHSTSAVVKQVLNDRGVKSVDELSQEHWRPIDEQFKDNLLNIKGPFQSKLRIDKYENILSKDSDVF